MNGVSPVFRGIARVPTLIAFMLVGSFATAWVVVGYAAAGSGDQLRPPGLIAGQPILERSLNDGDLVITNVIASAFVTTVEARLRVSAEIEEGAIVTVPADALTTIGFDRAGVTGLMRDGPRSFALVVQGDRILPGTNLVALRIARYLVVPAGNGDLVPVAGPWVAEGIVSPERIPNSALLPSSNSSRVDTGAGLIYVLDEVAFDGTSTRATYHLEGDLNGVAFLPGVPNDPSAIPGIDISDGSASGTVVIAGRPERESLRFPSAFRHVEYRVEAILPIGSTTPATINTPHGNFTASWLQGNDGQLVIQLVGHDVLATLSPGSSSDVALEDDLGNTYRLEKGRVTVPARWDDSRPAMAVMLFAGRLAPAARSATLRLAAYDVLIVGNWEVPVSFPSAP